MSPPEVTSSTAPAAAERRCLSCGAASAQLQRCGGCRRVFFCDRDCQVRAWRQHRPLCALEPKTPPPPPPSAALQTKPKAPAASALHTKRAASPKSVRLVTEPMQALELPASAQRHQAAQEAQAAAAAAAAAAASSSSPPKKKKSKHKKKKRSNSMHAPASAPLATPELKGRSMSLSVRKHIMWGDVSAREFARFPGGGGAVPYDGTWALGLGAAVADVELGSVLAVEELREQELRCRIQGLPKNKRGHVREGETRQFDYCRGVENPLFARLSERERKQIFVDTGANESHASHEMRGEDGDEHPHRSKRKSSISSSSSSPKQSPHLRARKLSHPISEGGSDADDLDTPDFACVSIEQLDEFARIRDSREGACGCSCGDLVKKVAKMHVKRLHAFLAERGVVITGHSKPELLALAKAVAMEEKNCANAERCECARNGVECHSNVCDGCVGDCWNPFKAYAYNKKEVGEYRKQQIAKWREANAKATDRQQAIAVA